MIPWEVNAVAIAMYSTFATVESYGGMADLLPELVVDLGVALAITQRELMLEVIELEYGPIN